MSDICGRYVEFGGHRIFYESAGSGRPVVCIHTAGQNALQWRYVLPFLAELGYQALAPDLPGHGRSFAADWMPIRVLHHYADIVWEMCARLKLNDPVFLGCSIGANIALDLGVHHPSEIRGLIVCEGAAYTPTVPEAVIRLMLEDCSFPGAGDQAFYGALGICGSRTSAERKLEMAWTARTRDPKIMANDLYGWIGHDVREHLGKITCPVLLVRGEEDFFVPRELVLATRDAIRAAEFVELAGSGHCPHVESPELLPLIEKFLRRHQL